jgi:FkbM family methyltransferase
MVKLIKRILRPVREVALHLISYRCGVPTTVNGNKFRVDSRTRLSFSPLYDVGASNLLNATLRHGDEAWNVGANVGVHVLQMCACVGPTGHVVAFEPNPEAAKLLRRNVALNGYSERVTIIEAAMGQHPGTTDFYISGANAMGRPQRPNPLLPRTKRIQVPVLTLDQFASERRKRPTCLFMDIEGWEIAALLGGEKLIPRLPLSIVEFHPVSWPWSGHSRAQLEDWLRTFELEVVPLSNQSDPMTELGQVWLRPRREISKN